MPETRTQTNEMQRANWTARISPSGGVDFIDSDLPDGGVTFSVNGFTELDHLWNLLDAVGAELRFRKDGE